MGVLELIYHKVRVPRGEGIVTYENALSDRDYQRFNPAVLGLGDIPRAGKERDVIAAVFDLEGFSAFCDAPDAHLDVPVFLEEFLRWLFDDIRKRLTQQRRTTARMLVPKKQRGRVLIWGQLPFFAKFTGDGVLLLWNAEDLQPQDYGNILVSLRSVTRSYPRVFPKIIRRRVTEYPKRLRCGVARGKVTGIGENMDFVGSCINLAARLQKTGGLTFAFSSRGFDLRKTNRDFADDFELKTVQIRGLRKAELILVDRSEFNTLPKKRKALFQNP
jgi:class 3 adenylate cyclase